MGSSDCGNFERLGIIEFLASKGARFDVKNKQGRTAAELARGRAAVLITKLSQ